MTTVNITEGQETISLTVSDGIPEPSNDGQGYARKWDGTQFIWEAVATTGSLGTVTSIAITGAEFTIIGSPITTSGTIDLAINAIATSKVTGLDAALASIPSNTSELVNDSGFITGIDSNAVVTALGYTPQNSATAFDGNYTSLINIPTYFTPTTHNHAISEITNLESDLNNKQDTLISGINIKTINSTSLLGSGNIDIGGGTSNAYIGITDGVFSAAASGESILKFRSANNVLGIIVGNDDPIHGDNILLTINQNNISIAQSQVTDLVSDLTAKATNTDLINHTNDATIHFTQNSIDHTLISNIGTNTHGQIDSHIASVENPHSVTKTQIGLSNVDNTADIDKPISTATQTALDLKQDVATAFSGNYNDLTNQPTIPTNISQLSNDTGYITGINSDSVITALGYTPQNSATAFNGNYSSLIGIPTEFTPAAHNQAISTITGLQDALALKLESSDISNFETTTQLNNRDTSNRDRANHTGTQDISTTTGNLPQSRLGLIRHYVVISSPTDKIYPIFPTIPYAITIDSVILKTESGSCSCTFKINSTVITGLSTLSASSVSSTIAALGSNITIIGDTINLEVTSSSSPVNLSIVVQYTIN